MNLEDFVDEHGGVVTVTELSGFLDAPESRVRRWARENDVRRAGSVFVFDLVRAEALADDLDDEDEDLEEEDEDFDDEDEDEDEDDDDE